MQRTCPNNPAAPNQPPAFTAILSPHDYNIACNSAILATLPEHKRDRLLQYATLHSVGMGRNIVRQEEAVESLFIVLEGWVKIYRASPSMIETVVAVMPKAGSFGIEAALNGHPSPASAEAITPTRLLVFDGEQIRQLMGDDPDVAGSVLSASLAQFRLLIDQVETLKRCTGAQRLASFLMDLCDESGGACIIPLPYSKGLIAVTLGMSPESLSRAFAKLRMHGVHTDDRVATIKDSGRLREMVKAG